MEYLYVKIEDISKIMGGGGLYKCIVYFIYVFVQYAFEIKSLKL